MPTATYIQDGKNIDYTPGSAVDAGDIVVQGEWIGIAPVAIPANTLGALAVEGIWEIPKANSTDAGYAISYGQSLYWDVGDEEAKTDSENGANKWIGTAVEAELTAATTVKVKLNGIPGIIGAIRKGLTTVTNNEVLVTGLSLVQTAVVSIGAAPTLNAMWASFVIPTQTGSDAGKFTIAVTKPTAANDVTPVASTTATPVGWMAIGVA